MQSDMFMERAVSISEGSLSPTIKWKTLANQEFPLPPRKRQEEMLETLTRLEKIVSARESLMNSSQMLEQALIKEILDSSTTTVEYSGKELLEKGFISMLQDGNHGSQYPKAKEFVEEGFLYLTASNISESGQIDFAGCAKLSKEKAASLRISPAQGGDVILTHNATIGRTAIIPSDLGIVIGSTSTTYYRPNKDKLLAEYLFIFMRSNFFQAQLKSVMKQTTRNQIPITAQKRLKFLVPEIEVQNKVLQIMENTIKPSLKIDFVDKAIRIRREYIQKMLTEAA
jgi:type I restriction enzyme S subunit